MKNIYNNYYTYIVVAVHGCFPHVFLLKCILNEQYNIHCYTWPKLYPHEESSVIHSC